MEVFGVAVLSQTLRLDVERRNRNLLKPMLNRTGNKLGAMGADAERWSTVELASGRSQLQHFLFPNNL